MRVIGVLDLLDGRAVHARGGRRTEYVPVQQACGEAIEGDAVRLARAYTERLGLEELYAADLDAIASGRGHGDLVTTLARIAPLWLDAGITSSAAAQRAAGAGAARIVVGLETLSSWETLSEICQGLGRDRVAFSVDLRNRAPVDHALEPNASPERFALRAALAGAGAVIVLDLARVGAGGGPDLQMVMRLRDVLPDAMMLVAGGGVRDLDDLEALASSGCDGALVATALIEGRLTAPDVAAAREFSRSSHGKRPTGRSSPRPPSQSP